MDQATHNKIVSFIWAIADDVLRDLFKRGKYPDVILPMCVIRRMDAVLEPTKQKVLDTKKMLDEAHITEQRAALCDAAGQAFYNTSKFTLRDLKSRGSQQYFARNIWIQRGSRGTDAAIDGAIRRRRQILYRLGLPACRGFRRPGSHGSRAAIFPADGIGGIKCSA